MGLVNGFISVLKKFERSQVGSAKVSYSLADQGGGAQVTTEHFQSANEDSHPLPGDYVICVPVKRQGGFAAVGYIDPKNPQEAAAGEKRIYARNAAGDIVCVVWVKADGSIQISNNSGSFVMQAGGNVVINGVTIATNGNITTNGDITSNGTVTGSKVMDGTIELGTHIHSGGTISGNTGAPI